MLPTPHGPTDAPLPVSTGDATVDTGRTPDEVALLRVVEHLAEVPDGDPEDTVDDDAAHAGDDATPDAETVDPTPEDEAGEPDDADDEPADQADDADDAPADEPADQAEDEPADQADDQADDVAADQAATAAAPPAPAVEVGPVAAALSDTRHRIDELNAAERLFLAQQRALVGELCPDPSDAEAVGALFDRVREAWVQSPDRPDLQPLADAFGVALGDLVCAQAPDLGWATCSDRFGTEIVLAREDPEVLVYPIAAVAQHWLDASPGWLVRHLATVVHGVSPEPAASDA
ncbi:DUF3806 domain-containing protein [Cellulomonas phragmiteti]|uniref:DUF3806 domain-containing protein n=1 Tax=Cellulomonas phragmiteti TaxID=478780 RepID=UPI00194204F6|nr:DUF3806 domain-containing protein [Cellulomonas phragmiteti]